MSQQRKGRPNLKNRGRVKTEEERVAIAERSRLLPHEHFVKMASIRKLQPMPENKGEANGRAVLTNEQVIEIRKEYDAHMKNSALPWGFFSETEKKYGVYYSVVVKVCRRQSWKNLP